MKEKNDTANKAKESEIRVTHRVKSKALVEINRKLTRLQKERLLTTPFKSLVDLVEEINISGILLMEFLRRWDTHSLGIRVANRIISFSKLDVCFGLGLRIVGEPVVDDDRVDSIVKQLFDGEVINVPCIVKKMGELTSNECVEDFCRLYLLLAFTTFYFPQTTPTINTLPFSVLDDLDSLHSYDWGGKVYNKLVGSLNRTAPLLNEGKNIESVSIAGCAALLQIWTVEHFLLRPTPQDTCFPRFTDWIDVASGKCIVARIFESNKFVEVVALSEGDQSNKVLNEAIEEIERGHCKGRKENDIKIRLSIIEDKIKVFKTKVYKRASSSNEIDVSHNVPEASYAPPVANVSTATRDPKKLNKLLLSLYKFCTRVTTSTTKGETLVRMNDHILTRLPLKTLAPRKWVDNMVFCFVSPMLMEEELERSGFLTRFLFNSFYAWEVIKELQEFQAGTQKRWTL